MNIVDEIRKARAALAEAEHQRVLYIEKFDSAQKAALAPYSKLLDAVTLRFQDLALELLQEGGALFTGLDSLGQEISAYEWGRMGRHDPAELRVDDVGVSLIWEGTHHRLRATWEQLLDAEAARGLLPAPAAPVPEFKERLRSIELGEVGRRLSMVLADANVQPPVDRQGLCLECEAWTPHGHPEAHEHLDGCSAVVEYSRRRDWKSRIAAIVNEIKQKAL